MALTEQQIQESNVPFAGSPYGGLYQGAASSLLDVINNPGRTDARMFNQRLGAIGRGTQSRVASTRARFARGGLGNSGLALAFENAAKAGGQNQVGAAQAEEARRREELKRGDLGIYKNFIQDPYYGKYGIDRGVSVQQSAQSSANKQSAAAGAAALIGSLAAAFCHTADELYGIGSDEATWARYYMVFNASDETRDLYSKGSKDLAARVKDDPSLRAEVQPIFDHFVDVAKSDFASRH